MIPHRLRGVTRLTAICHSRNLIANALVHRASTTSHSLNVTTTPSLWSTRRITVQFGLSRSYSQQKTIGLLQELKEAAIDADIPRIHTTYRAVATTPQVIDKEVLRKVLLVLRKGKKSSDLHLLQRIISDMETVFNLPVSHFEMHALMYCYGVQHNPSAAYQVLRDMYARGISPNIYTYNTIIGVYKSVRDAKGALAIFDQMARNGVEPDVSTYNTMISLLASNADYDKARSLYNEMEEKGIRANQYTFSTLLKIAASTKDEKLGNNVMNRILSDKKTAAEVDVTTFNSILLLLSETTGSLDTLYEFYHTADSRFPHLKLDIVSYNTMLDACLKADHPSEAVKIIEDMSQAGLQPDVVTYGIMIDSQSKSKNVEEAIALFKEMTEKGIRANERVLSSLVNASSLGNENQIADIIKIIQSVSYRENLRPDRQAFNALLNSLANRADPDQAQKLFDTVFSERNSSRFHQPDIATYTSLITAYIKSGDMDAALDVYYAVKEKHVPARRRKNAPTNSVTLDTQFYTALITMFAQTADNVPSIDSEQQSDDRLSYAPAYIYTVEDDTDRRKFIEGEDNSSVALATALSLFTDMRQMQIRPNAHTYTTLLNAAAKHRDELALEHIHKLIKMDLYLDPDIAIYNGLMEAYNRTGQGHQVIQIWETLKLSSPTSSMQDKNIDQASVSIVLDSCAHNGYGYKAEEIWDQLKRSKFPLNTNNYNSYIEALCRMKDDVDWDRAYSIAQNEMTPQSNQSNDKSVVIDAKTVNTLLSFARKKGFPEDRIQEIEAWGQSVLLGNQT
jgi:pentatricopeptide repeat protein